MKKWILSTALSLAVVCFSWAQHQISGFVFDDQGQPVDYASVLLLQPADSSLIKGSLTDSTGQYLFEAIPEGSYLVAVNFIGYEDAYSEVFELHADRKVQALHLATNSAQLEEVVVKATKPFIELKADKIVMNVDASPVSAGNNALELLTKSPGVFVDQDNNISLKGKQGILILIDGKNTYLSSEELVRMLENMPASSIESIEIIHSPSAKYDAEGNAGVINIRLKKKENLGLNGSVSAGFSYGETPKANASTNLNYRMDKVNFFGNYSFRHHERNQELDINRNIPFEGMLTRFEQENDRYAYSDQIYLKTGVDYFLTDKTTIGLLNTISRGQWNEDGSNLSILSGDNPFDFSQVKAVNNHKENWNNYSYNFNIQHQIDDKGQMLTFDADWSTFDNPQEQLNNNRYLNASGLEVQPPDNFRTDNDSNVEIKAAKLDYTLPFNDKWNFESGLKASIVKTESDLNFSILQEDVWTIDPLRSNAFNYEESIYAAYANVSTQWKGMQIQAGLRSEYTQSDGISLTLNQRVKRDYLNFFPSLSLSHTLAEKHNLSYAFSRRIDRPNYGNLNPFIFYLDQFTFGKGNPFLQPQYTNNLTVNYGFQQYFFVTLSYSRTNDAITDVIEQNEETRQIFQTRDNLDLFENYSANFSTSIPWKNWFSTRVNVSTFYNIFDSQSAEGLIQEDQLSTHIYLSNNFQINKQLQAELSGWYQSPMVYGMVQIREQYTINAGLSARLFNGKANLKLGIDDIFDTLRFAMDVNQGDVDAFVYQKNETQKVNISFTYNFGNNKVKPARRRSTATSDEKNRVNRN